MRYKVRLSAGVVAIVLGIMGLILASPTYAAGDSVAILGTPISRCGNQSMYATGTASYANVSTGRLLMVHLDGVKVYQNPDRPTAWSTDLFTITTGTHSLTAKIYRRSGINQSLAASATTEISIPACASEGGGGSGGGGGGGGGGSDNSSATGLQKNQRVVRLPDAKKEGKELTTTITETGRKPIVQQAEKNVTLTGNTSYSSSNHKDGKRAGILLAHGNVQANYPLSVSKANYLVEILGKHDQPGPIKAQLLLNNKPWRIIYFSKGDNTYEKKAAGILKNFTGGTLTLKFLNDSFTCTAAQVKAGNIAKCDRNLLVDQFILTAVK